MRKRSRKSLRRSSLIAAGVGLIGALGFAAWWLVPPGDIDAYASGAPASWAKRRADEGDNPKRRSKHTYLPLASIDVDVQFAVLCGEDIGFFAHGPWDTEAMREAVDEWVEGEKLRGGSTITQQLAKNLFLSDDRSLLRKLREARYAYWLEEILGKRRVFELYLNVLELGPGIYGVEAGSQEYFGVSARSLGRGSAAELAATIPSPLRHNPRERTKTFEVRYAAIVRRMDTYDQLRERLVAMQRPKGHRAKDAAAPAVKTAAGTPATRVEAQGASLVPASSTSSASPTAPPSTPPSTIDQASDGDASPPP